MFWRFWRARTVRIKTEDLRRGKGVRASLVRTSSTFPIMTAPPSSSTTNESLLVSVAQLAKSSLDLGEQLAASSAKVGKLLEKTNAALAKASEAVEREELEAVDAKAAIDQAVREANRRGVPSCGVRCRSAAPTSNSAPSSSFNSSGASKAEVLLAKAERALTALEHATGNDFGPTAELPAFPPARTSLDFSLAPPPPPSMTRQDSLLNHKISSLQKIYLSRASDAILAVFPPASAAPPLPTRSGLARSTRGTGAPGSVSLNRRQLEAERAKMAVTSSLERRKELFDGVRARYQTTIKKTQEALTAGVLSRYEQLQSQLMTLLKNEVIDRLSSSMDLRSSRPFSLALMKTATSSLAQLEVRLHETEVNCAADTVSALAEAEAEIERLIDLAVREAEDLGKRDREQALAAKEGELVSLREAALAAVAVEVRRELEKELARQEEAMAKETAYLIEKERRTLIPRLTRENEIELERQRGKLEEERLGKMKRAEEDLKAEMQRKHDAAKHQLQLQLETDLRGLKAKVEEDVKAEQARELRDLEAALSREAEKKVAALRDDHRRRMERDLQERRKAAEEQEKDALEEEAAIMEEERRHKLAEAEDEAQHRKHEAIGQLHRQAEEAIAAEVESYRQALEEGATKEVNAARRAIEEDTAASLEALFETVKTDALFSTKTAARVPRQNARTVPNNERAQQTPFPARHHPSSGAKARTSSHSCPSSSSSSSFSSMAARAIARTRDRDEEDEQGDEISAVNITRLSSLNPRSPDVSFLSVGTGGGR